MADVVRDFFEGLTESCPNIPKVVSGTLRFDVEDGGHGESWLVTFDKGRVSVSESSASADCVTRIDRATLASIIDGRANLLAAILRGVVSVEGRSMLLAVFRSVLQGAAVTAHEPSERLLVGRRS